MANEALAGWFPSSRFTSTMSQPGIAPGAFILDGATDPSQTAGVVESVRRLVDASARPFFRVKLNTRLPLTALSTMIVPSVRGTAITDDLSWNVGAFTAAPAASFDENFEFDIAVLNAGVPVDTADFRVEFGILAALSNPVEVV